MTQNTEQVQWIRLCVFGHKDIIVMVTVVLQNKRKAFIQNLGSILLFVSYFMFLPLSKAEPWIVKFLVWFVTTLSVPKFMYG